MALGFEETDLDSTAGSSFKNVSDSQVCSRGEIIKVKVLGTLALIDEGETDWKVVVINTEDPEAADFNSMNNLLYKLCVRLENMASATQITLKFRVISC